MKDIENILKENKKSLSDMQLIDEYCKDFDYEKTKKFVNDYVESDIPLPYLTAFEIFNGLKIKVNSNVLIPRMETLEVIYKCIDVLKAQKPKGSKINIVDVCTGSGVILITLYDILKDYYEMDLSAIDISQSALDVATLNFLEYKMNVSVHKGDLLTPVLGEKFDLIIANPPYIAPDGEVSDNVFKYEPHIALFAKDNGMKCYNSIIKDSNKCLNKNALMCFEIGYDQRKYFEKMNLNLEIFKDLNNNDRICIIRS